MTVPAPGPLTYSYSEDGVTTIFAYPVRFIEAQELVVIRTVGGVATTLTMGVDYTVSGEGNPAGGSITRTAATNGGTITIYRDTTWKQIVDLEDKQRNPAQAVEDQLDRLTMAGQDARAAIGVLQNKTGDLDEAVARAEAAKDDAEDAKGDAEAAQLAAEAAQVAAENAATSLNLPTIGAGDAGKSLIVNQDEDGYELTDSPMLKGTYDPTNVAADVFNSANSRFLHSGAGAASRNVRDKLRDIVDIRDYGAKCDGVTDDLAAIQAALAAHPTGVIKFPAGRTVNISAAIVINTGAPTLCSEGAFPAVIRTTSLTDDIIRIACGSQILSNIGVHNLRFDATAAKTAGAGLAITSNSGYALYHGKFHDLQMSNKMHTGISCISGGFYNFFERIFINGVAPNSQGIRFQGSGSGSPWANVYMHDIAVINGRSNAGGSNTIGWLISNYCEGVYAARVSLESDNLNLGLYVGGTQVRHLWFNTLIVDDTNGAGITITTASVIRLTDCWTTSTEGNGIAITNGYDIEIKGHVAISNALSGIKIDGGSLIRIIGGCIAGNSRSPTNSAVGAYIAAGVSDWMIRDVMFDKSGAGVKTHYADIFVVSGGSDRYSITGCHLFGGATTSLSDGGSGSTKNVAGNITG